MITLKPLVTLAIITSFPIVVLEASAAAIPPLILSTASTTSEVQPLMIDRAGARELARFTAKLSAPRLEPNLRHEANVETLETPVVLLADRSSKNGGSPFALNVLGKIVVDGARTLRLNMSGATPGTVLWIAGSDDEELERFEPNGDTTWSPTTHGSTVYIAAQSVTAGITIAKMAIGTLATTVTPSCAKDAACAQQDQTGEIRNAGRAIALINFVRGDASYSCTGGVLNDALNSQTPYMLTAQHCISNAAEAASIEAVWNLRFESCGSTQVASVTRTYGAKLLVASASSDVALLRLNRRPPGGVFLGIDPSRVQTGTETYRLSHASGAPLTYSTGAVHTAINACGSAPQPAFLYTRTTEGAIASGSSGAPLLVKGLRVVGQLLGRCGPSPNDACAIYNDTVDGSIAESWPLLAPYLDPPAPVRKRTARM